MQYNRRGEEMPDPTPLALPIGFEHPPTIEELYARLVLDPQHVRELQKVGVETEEEANDFDVPDEVPDPTSPYQDPHSVITDADEMRNGFRQKLNAAMLAQKARNEIEAARKLAADKKIEDDKNAKG